MIDTPQIIQTTAELTAMIQLTIPRSEIRSAMGPGISEVIAAAKAQGIGPAGPWFTHHLKMDPCDLRLRDLRARHGSRCPRGSRDARRDAGHSSRAHDLSGPVRGLG